MTDTPPAIALLSVPSVVPLTLPELIARLQPSDLLVLTADHGNDPTWRGTDHTRERVPILCFGPGVRSRNIGVRNTYADIGTIADHLHYVGANPHGGNNRSDSAGGGHAHCGTMIYQGGTWPAEYHNQFFLGICETCNFQSPARTVTY